MGFGGFTIMLQKAHSILNLPAIFGTVFVWITAGLALLISVVYSIKAVRFFGVVKTEFRNKIRINFFAAVSIVLLMHAIIFEHISPNAQQLFFFLGTFIHSALTLYTVRFWIQSSFQIKDINPAWFIPIVGNLLVPVAGHALLDHNILSIYLIVGLFFWLALFAITFMRLIFESDFHKKFNPTLFIFIAPPAVIFIAYVKMTGDVDLFAKMMLGLAYYFTLQLLVMFRGLMRIPYFVSWWALIFPMAAVSIASMLSYKTTQIVVYKMLSIGLMDLTALLFTYVLFATVRQIMKGEFCVPE